MGAAMGLGQMRAPLLQEAPAATRSGHWVLGDMAPVPATQLLPVIVLVLDSACAWAFEGPIFPFCRPPPTLAEPAEHEGVPRERGRLACFDRIF